MQTFPTVALTSTRPREQEKLSRSSGLHRREGPAMPAGGAGPTGNPWHDAGFEPPGSERKLTPLRRLRETHRSRHPALQDRRTG